MTAAAFETGVLAFLFLVFLPVISSLGRGRTLAARPLVDVGTFVLVGLAVNELIGPGPIVVSLLAGGAAALLFRAAPPAAGAVFGAVALGYSIRRALLGGMCEPPLGLLKGLLVVILLTGVVVAFRRIGGSDLGVSGHLVDHLLVLYGTFKILWFMLTPIGGPVIGYRPSIGWWLLVLAAYGLWIAHQQSRPEEALRVAVAMLGASLLASRVVLVASVGQCGANPRSDLAVAGTCLITGVATTLLRPFGNNDNRWMSAVSH